MVKRILTWGGIAFLIFLVALRPSMAADAAVAIGRTIGDMANGAWEFLKSVS